MKMKKYSILTAAALTLCLLTGCGGGEGKGTAISKEAIVGTWVNTMSDGTETLTLKDDMTYEKVIELGGSVPVKSKTNDTWTLSGNTITVSYSNYNTTSEYTVTVDGNTMTWDNGDSQIVYQKK